MKHNLFWKVISLLVITSFVLVACGTPATEAPAATEAPTKAPATEAPAMTEAPAAGDVALRWRTRPDNQEEINVYSEISNELDGQLDGISLTYEPGGTEGANYQDQLRAEVAAGTAPDVFWIPGTDVADFATRGLILNVSDLATKTEGFDVKAFYSGPMYHLTYNPDTDKTGADSGALWGLPRDVSTFALYLNMDLINEAGAPDPRELAKQGKWDWNAFLEVAQKTRALGSDIYGYGASAWWGPNGVWINAAGGSFFNADRTACALNTPEALKGLDFQRSLYADYDVAVPYGEDPEPPFRAGKVAMFQNGRWATPGVRTVTFNWDVVELPNGPSGTPGNWLFWGAYVINAKTEHPEEAWKLVQALTTAQTQGKVAALGANIPSRVSQEALDAFLTFTPPANNQAFLNGIADSAKPTAEGPVWAGSWPEFDKIVGPAIQAVLTGGTTIDDFGATICDEANKVFTK
ncbi:MAG: sugar ABC transporter substrate-binding protein [Chloroflexi bacterium]|nr:sugar ABC transporter substrate-binding protein [Chloroflexota bacterium]